MTREPGDPPSPWSIAGASAGVSRSVSGQCPREFRIACFGRSRDRFALEERECVPDDRLIAELRRRGYQITDSPRSSETESAWVARPRDRDCGAENAVGQRQSPVSEISSQV
jgi:hypothetical protein